MINVIWIARCDDARLHRLDGIAQVFDLFLIPSQFLFQHPTDSGNTEVKPRPGQYLGDLDISHTREERFELPDNCSHKLWKLVDRFGHLKQSMLTTFVEPSRPIYDGSLIEKKRSCRLCN